MAITVVGVLCFAGTVFATDFNQLMMEGDFLPTQSNPDGTNCLSRQNEMSGDQQLLGELNKLVKERYDRVPDFRHNYDTYLRDLQEVCKEIHNSKLPQDNGIKQYIDKRKALIDQLKNLCDDYDYTPVKNLITGKDIFRVNKIKRVFDGSRRDEIVERRICVFLFPQKCIDCNGESSRFRLRLSQMSWTCTTCNGTGSVVPVDPDSKLWRKTLEGTKFRLLLNTINADSQRKKEAAAAYRKNTLELAQAIWDLVKPEGFN